MSFHMMGGDGVRHRLRPNRASRTLAKVRDRHEHDRGALDAHHRSEREKLEAKFKEDQRKQRFLLLALLFGSLAVMVILWTL